MFLIFSIYNLQSTIVLHLKSTIALPRLLRITTVPISLHLLLQGQFRYMRENGFEVITISADGWEVEEVLKEGVEHKDHTVYPKNYTRP